MCIRDRYTVVAWGFVDWFPAFFIRIFNREGDVYKRQ